MRFRPRRRLDSILPWTVGCALGLLGWAPAQRIQPFADLRPSPGRLVGLDYQPLLRRIPQDQARAIRREASRLVSVRSDDRRPGLLRTKSIYLLAENQPDPAAYGLEEAVATTEGSEQALLRSDLAALLLARSWPGWRGRPGYFPRGDDLFRAVELAAQALEVVPDLREAQFNLALALEAIGLRETPKEEWRKYLALDALSPWANEAREHLARLAVPVAIQERPNALQPEGVLDDSDPAVRIYRTGRAVLREQRYDEARAAFREARALWRKRDPRMAGWATYRIALCDYFDPKITPRNVPHGDGPHFHFYEGPAGGTMIHLCSAFGPGENLRPILENIDPELVARASYLLGNQETGLRDRDGNHVYGVGLQRAYETGDLDLIARLESSFAVQLQQDRDRAGLHHLVALRGSLRVRSLQTRLLVFSNVAEWTANSGNWHLTTFIGQEYASWISQHSRSLDPVSALQADLLTSWSANNENKLALARAAIMSASRKALRIPDRGLRSALMDQIFGQEWSIHISEQKALFSRQSGRQVPQAEIALIDRDRLMPELQPLYRQATFCPCTNLWPLIEKIQRAMDAREGRVNDIPVIRRYDWLTTNRWLPGSHLLSGQDPIVNVFGPRKRVEPPFAHAVLAFPGSFRERVDISFSSAGGNLAQRPMRLTSLKAGEYLREWQQGIGRPTSERFRRWSEGLMRDVGVPFVQTLSPSVEKVGILSGRSILDFLPFAAIRDPHSGRFLVELYELFVLPEYSTNPERYFSQPVEPSLPPLAEATRARAIGTFRVPRSSPEPRVLLVVGSASADDPHSLQGGEKEIEELARRFPNHRILRGAEATKERVLAELRTATLAHFAAHGWVDDAYPDETGLILRPGERGGVRLTVGDLRNLEAPNLRLVVLSTCNSAHATTSPESLSLASAFIARGVPAVVASLASIQDRTAPRFFADFYSHLDETGDPIRALRSAQIDFARGPDPEGTLRTWAPYVVMVTPGFRISE